MSSVWAALEAAKRERDPADFPRCGCDDSDHAGWTFDPVKEERTVDFHDFQFVPQALDMMRMVGGNGMFVGRSADPKTKAHQAKLLPLVLPLLLGKHESYRVPHSAEEERRHFRSLLKNLLRRMENYGLYPDYWPDELEDLDDTKIEPECVSRFFTQEYGLTQERLKMIMEGLVWHYDPRLQLIHYPSFRCFVEVKFLTWHLDLAMQKFNTIMTSGGSTAQTVSAMTQICDLYATAPDCIAYYALEVGLVEGTGSKEEPEPAPPLPVAEASSQASSAGPSLTKAQRKHAKQKANKAAARLAKETTASSSRSDYLPKMPIHKPPAVAPKKKKAVSAMISASVEAAGGSWAAVESGQSGEACKASPEPETGPEDVTESESATEPEPRAKETTGEGGGAETEASATVTAELAVEETPVSPAVVEAVGPSGAFALLAHDLARIAERLRKARLAKP